MHAASSSVSVTPGGSGIAAFLAFQSAEGVGKDGRRQPQRRPHVRHRRRFLGHAVVDAFGPGVGADQIVGDHRRIILARVQVFEHRPQHFGVIQRNVGWAEHWLGSAVWP